MNPRSLAHIIGFSENRIRFFSADALASRPRPRWTDVRIGCSPDVRKVTRFPAHREVFLAFRPPNLAANQPSFPQGLKCL